MDYIKLMRAVKDKAYYSRDSEKLHLWIHLLLTANWTEREEMLGGKPILCKAGQFTTGRKQLSMQTGISESKIERILTYFEKIEQQIEQQKTSTNRLISILNWSKYQVCEQQSEQRVNNDRTTSEQRVNTLKEYKEYKEIKDSIEKSKRFSPPTLLEVEDYCFERKNTVDASKFIDYYTSNGWKVGKNAMKDWRAAVRTWEKTQNNNNNENKQRNGLDADAKWRAEMEASIARDYAALHE